MILGWCTDTDEGEADSQRLSIYSAQPRDADTLQRLLTSSCQVGVVDVMVKWQSFGAIMEEMVFKNSLLHHLIQRYNGMPVTLPTAGHHSLIYVGLECLSEATGTPTASLYRSSLEPKYLFALIAL